MCAPGGDRTVKDPVLVEYQYELKENLGRRAIALLIDLAIVAVMELVLSGFIIAGIMLGNIFALLFGPLGDLIFPLTIEVGGPPSVFIYMLVFFIVHPIVSLLYFSIMESNGRTTFGKRAMHLETLKSDGTWPSFMEALKRNWLKAASGALGAYLIGLLGMGLFTGIACLIDLQMGPERKRDVRQRMTEVPVDTYVQLEDDDQGFGSISIDGGEYIKRKQQAKEERKKQALLEKQRKDALSLQQAKEAKEEKKKLLGAPVEEKKEAAPAGELKEAGAPEDKPQEKEVKKEELVLSFMLDLDIDEQRAQGLYDAGYRSKEDLKEAIPKDLIMIKGINPTIAKKIIERASL